MLILRSASARDETTGWGQPLSQHWLGTVLCWAHSGDTYRGGHCVSTDHCPPSLDICTSTHRACSGCMSSPCLEPPVVGGFPCCWRPEQVSFLRGPLELSYDSLHVDQRRSRVPRPRYYQQTPADWNKTHHLLFLYNTCTALTFLPPTWTLFLHWTLVELHLS